jgi:hypothetical protein
MFVCRAMSVIEWGKWTLSEENGSVDDLVGDFTLEVEDFNQNCKSKPKSVKTGKSSPSHNFVSSNLNWLFASNLLFTHVHARGETNVNVHAHQQRDKNNKQTREKQQISSHRRRGGEFP